MERVCQVIAVNGPGTLWDHSPPLPTEAVGTIMLGFLPNTSDHVSHRKLMAANAIMVLKPVLANSQH